MRVFCDSSFFIAFYDANDQYHKDAVSFLPKLAKEHATLYSSDYVLDETYTFLLKTHPRFGYLRAKTFDEHVISRGEVHSIFITEMLFQKARALFFRFNKDKRWSFTDCTSFAIMEDYGIRDVLGFDQNFMQRGFRLLPSLHEK